MDISVAYKRYQFLGSEFLSWLWFVIENHQDDLNTLDADFIALEIGNQVVFENSTPDSSEKISIRGDDAGLEEGMLALKKGALVTEINLVYHTGEHRIKLTLKGESLHVTGLKIPETAAIESAEDIEGGVLESVFWFDKVFGFIDGLFNKFIHLRLSDQWTEQVAAMKVWLAAETPGQR